MDTKTHTNTHRHTQTHTQTHTHKHTHKHTQTHTHAHTHKGHTTYTHTHRTHTHTRTHAHMPARRCPAYQDALEGWFGSAEFQSQANASAGLRAQVAARWPGTDTSLENW